MTENTKTNQSYKSLSKHKDFDNKRLRKHFKWSHLGVKIKKLVNTDL